MKKYLFIIDPQNDFIEGGSLAVPGGKEALQRIVDSGILDRGDWERIIVTLDSHNPSHLGFGEPKTTLQRHLTRRTPKPTQWPPHCIIDTHGWEIYGPLQDKLLEMEDVMFVKKGMNDTTDAYSIEDAELIILENFGEEAEIYWTGLAEDYCVYESIKSFLKVDLEKKIHHILLTDMTAPIKNHIHDENIDIKLYIENS